MYFIMRCRYRALINGAVSDDFLYIAIKSDDPVVLISGVLMKFADGLC
jgi:hypothetical protein